MPSSLVHADGCPNNRLNVHYPRQRIASKLPDEPINPLKVSACAPVGNSNVNMISKRDPIFKGARDDLGRQ
jgi:hypothetical protein